MLVRDPQRGFIRQIVDNAVDCAAVSVIVVPGPAAHDGQDVHGRLLVRDHAVCPGQLLADALVAVVPLLLPIRLIVSGLEDMRNFIIL